MHKNLWKKAVLTRDSSCKKKLEYPIFKFRTSGKAFLTIKKVYLTKKFNMKMYTTRFLYCSIISTVEWGTCGSS